MSYLLLFLFLGLTTAVDGETRSELERIKERLEHAGDPSSIIEFAEPPEAVSYLNHNLLKNAPHKIELTQEITKLIHDWSPRLLALDPTCPYYFSKLTDPTAPDEDLNLFSYLQAIESNKTLKYPFINILPQSFRNAIPLLSIFRCQELIQSTSDRFFHNVELILGPGKTELPLERQSNMYSQLYCSLSGWPHFVLVNQTKQPTTTYNAETLLSQDNLADVDFSFTSLAPGTCLYVPPGWVIGAQLNNSISLVYTLKKIQKPTSENEPLVCTTANETALDTIEFSISDKFNVTDIGLIVYFYQYLNPPMFDKQYTAATFFDHFREDRNISQLVMKWTPSLTDLINNTLFKQLDINNDGIFSVNDYFQIKQSTLKQLHSSVYEILEKLRQTVVAQYSELNDTITKFSQSFSNMGTQGNTEEALQTLIESLPDQIKEKLKEKNVNVQQILAKVKSSKKPSTDKQRVREDDASILFDANQDEQIGSTAEQDQEEDITAEPIANEDDPHRTDL